MVKQCKTCGRIISSEKYYLSKDKTKLMCVTCFENYRKQKQNVKLVTKPKPGEKQKKIKTISPKKLRVTKKSLKSLYMVLLPIIIVFIIALVFFIAQDNPIIPAGNDNKISSYEFSRNSYVVNGVEDKISDLFLLTGSSWHLNIMLYSNSDNPNLQINIYDEDENQIKSISFEESFLSSERIDINSGSGWYFLEVKATNLQSWTVWIYDHISSKPEATNLVNADSSKIGILDYELFTNITELNYEPDYSNVINTVSGKFENKADKMISHVCVVVNFFDSNKKYINSSLFDTEMGDVKYFYDVSSAQTIGFKFIVSQKVENYNTDLYRAEYVTFEIYY